MSYNSLTSAQIAAGQPTSQDIFSKQKGNEDDHETRIATLEGSLNRFTPLIFGVTGNYYYAVPLNEVLATRIAFNITLTGARILVVDAGTAGTLDCDVKYKRGAGAWTSIFSTRPTVIYSAGNYALSTNAVISTAALLAADLLRLDIITGQEGNTQFSMNLEFQAT